MAPERPGMSGQTWFQTLQTDTSAPTSRKTTINIMGPDKIPQLQRSGNSNAVIDYAYTESDGPDGTTHGIGIYRFPHPTSGLLKLALNNDEQIVLLCLDWKLDPKGWPSVVHSWLDLLENVLATTHRDARKAQIDAQLARLTAKLGRPLADHEFSKRLGVALLFVVQNAPSAEDSLGAEFDAGMEYLQQYLRTIALLYGAGLVYLRPDIDILDLIGYELGGPVGGSHTFAEPAANVVDNKVVIPSGWDSKDKILATNGRFPFDAVIAGAPVEVPEIKSTGVDLDLMMPAITRDELVEPVDISRIIESYGGPASPYLDSRPSSRSQHQGKGKSANPDDKEALSNYFDTVIDRTNSSPP